MAVKTWDDDFRKDAIEASLRKLGGESLDDPFCYDGSFCLPVGERPLLGWTPFRIRIYAECAGFVLIFGLAVYTIVCSARGAAIPASRISPLIIAIFVVEVVIHQLLILRRAEILILRRLLQDRIRNRLQEFETAQLIPCELIPPDAGCQTRYFHGDDYALIFLDEKRRRILIEGVTARYQIRADDVTGLEKFTWVSTLNEHYRSGALVTCRIDETTELTLAAVRQPGYFEFLQQSLLTLFLSRARRDALQKNQLIGPFKQTLQFSDVTGGPKEEFETQKTSHFQRRNEYDDGD